jgi:hypothetical protein
MMNRPLTYLALLVIFLAGAARGQSTVDSLFRVVDSLYSSGAYARVELEARRLLESQLLSDSVSLVAEQWVPFALVAQGEPALAREHFRRILLRRPQYQLDQTLTSPKILAVFNEARSLAAETRHVDSIGAAEADRPGGITFRTVLFPGWEQLYQERTTAGAIFLGAGIASLGAGIALEFVRRSARDEYLAATTPEEIESKYQEYNRASRNERWAFAAFAAVYILSEIDVFLHDSGLSLHLSDSGDPALSLSYTLR